MDALDLAFTPALEQARLIRTGEISPLELTELYLNRIQQLDGALAATPSAQSLGSYFTVTAELAIAQAQQMTEVVGNYLASSSGDRPDLPLFFGVPIAVKDLDPVAGMTCTYGVRALAGNVVEMDSGVVQRIKAAGFNILGKTAASELGSTPFCEGFGFPPTRNPWNLAYTAGGSSGGSAAAVAAGLCPLAQGSDGGGSVRGPAACCGVVGIKASRGRISWAPVGDRVNGIATQGTLARTVADAAALLDVLSGYCPGDPYWLPDPDPAFLTVAEQATQSGVSPLRVQVITEIPGMGILDPVCQDAVTQTADLLTELGHQVESSHLQITDLVTPFTAVWQAAIAEATIPTEWLSPFNQWLRQRAEQCHSGDYLRAVTQMQLISRRLINQFEHCDVLLLPVYLHHTIQIGQWADLPPDQLLEAIISWVAPCPPFNASGQPAIALPVGLAANGLPTSIQLVGKPADEATLIALAAQIEQARPWRDRRPPLS